MNASLRAGKGSVLLVAAVVLCVVIVALIYHFWDGNGNGNGTNGPNGEEEVKKLVDNARAVQSDNKISKADKKRAWEAVLAKIKECTPTTAVLDGYRDEATRNIEILESSEPTGPVTKWKRNRDERRPYGQDPAPVPADRLLRHYPVGRKIQSGAVILMTGQATDEKWLFKGEAGFLYQYRIVVETAVTKNDGAKVCFEQYFREVVQERAVIKDTTIELRTLPPTHPLSVFEAVVLKRIPEYVVIRNIVDEITTIDPHAKKTLTALYNTLKECGLVTEENPPELALQIEKLSGTKVRMVYWSGFGVESVEVLEGDESSFCKTDLERLAYGSSLLMDYYVFPGAEKAVGDRWEVKAEDASQLFNLYDADVSGTVSLRRQPDKEQRGRKFVVLELLGGELSVAGESADGRRSSTLRPKSGLVYYSAEGLFVDHASMTWHATDVWFPKRHLLSGSQKLRDIEMRSEYEAKDCTPPAAKSKGKE